MGQHEYEVTLSEASTPKDMEFVAHAFKAGILKERQRALEVIRNAMISGKTIDLIIQDIENGDGNA